MVAETLPTDILSRIDEHFFSFVREILGKSFSDLLEILQINSASCFLMTDDFLDVLNMDIEHKQLIDLKKSICFQLKDGSTVIKPGIVAGFKCFKEALINKREMIMKQMKKNKKPLFSSTAIDEQSSVALSPSNPTLLEISSQFSSYPDNSTSISFTLHKELLGQYINRWCQENKSNLGFVDLFLQDEGVDYTSRFTLNDQHEISCEITCRCGVIIKLSKKDDRFQMSNFYKHLRQTNCSHMSRLKELEQQETEEATIQRTSMATTRRAGTSSSITIQDDVERVSSDRSRAATNDSSTQLKNRKKNNRRSSKFYSQRQKRIRI